METKPFQTEALLGLCSQDQLDLLNAIDSLRSQGISHYVSLPQIVVCGDQSSGKSSVLEAISGVSFPVKSNLCTRFPTELVLRTSSRADARVSIVPHQSHSDSERLSLESFQGRLTGFEELPDLIENATATMKSTTLGGAFSRDLLRVEVFGPNLPHLTIVDLPGLIHSETKQQSTSDLELVRDIVEEYMKAPRSIILAVVSAKNDYANQIVLKLARDADKKGTRTLGVITKPDTLIAGSRSEAKYVSLANNKEVEFELGWHVLKNMNSEAGEYSLTDREMEEKQFFSQGIWKEVTRSLLGVNHLRERLSRVLLMQIAVELPSLISEINLKSDVCRSRIVSLGEPRATLGEQRHYLVDISQSFQYLAKAAADGTYGDPFFQRPTSEASYHRRIRARIQNLNQDFADEITLRGHRRKLSNSPRRARDSGGQISITRTEYLAYIEQLILRTRDRELPGTYNPLVVTDLFLEQSSLWEGITQMHIKSVWNAARKFLRIIIAHVADAATMKALVKIVFERSWNQILDDLQDKTKELLKSHQAGHPITYSRDFTETLQEVRNERVMEEYTEIMRDFFNVRSIESVNIGHNKDLRPLVTNLSQRTELDVKRLACSEALDCMQAYYKTALKRFIDDVAVEIVEAKLMSKLHSFFSPLTVLSMPDDLVTVIAGEPEESRAEREQLTKQLNVFKRGAETVQRFSVIKDFDIQDDANQGSQVTEGRQYDLYVSSEAFDYSDQEGTPSSLKEVLPHSPERGSPEVSIPGDMGEIHDLPIVEAPIAEVASPDMVLSFSKKRAKKGKAAAKWAMDADDEF